MNKYIYSIYSSIPHSQLPAQQSRSLTLLLLRIKDSKMDSRPSSLSDAIKPARRASARVRARWPVCCIACPPPGYFRGCHLKFAPICLELGQVFLTFAEGGAAAGLLLWARQSDHSGRAGLRFRLRLPQPQAGLSPLLSGVWAFSYWCKPSCAATESLLIRVVPPENFSAENGAGIMAGAGRLTQTRTPTAGRSTPSEGRLESQSPDGTRWPK